MNTSFGILILGLVLTISGTVLKINGSFDYAGWLIGVGLFLELAGLCWLIVLYFREKKKTVKDRMNQVSPKYFD